MTSESGVLGFLFCWLGPPGVSRAASASCVYGGGEGERKEEKRKEKEEGREGRERGKQKKERGKKEVKREGE